MADISTYGGLALRTGRLVSLQHHLVIAPANINIYFFVFRLRHFRKSSYTMDEPEDQVMNEPGGKDSYLPLSDDEERVLELYGKLQQLRLEIAVINAQRMHQDGICLVQNVVRRGNVTDASRFGYRPRPG